MPEHVIFFGLNTNIVHVIFNIPILFVIYAILKQEIKKINLNCLIIYTSAFFLFSLIANANLIYAELFLGPFHRVEFERQLLSIFSFTNPKLRNSYGGIGMFLLKFVQVF